MKNNVQISIIGINETDGDPERYQLVTEGEMDEYGDGVSYSYMESAITGLEGTKTTINVSNGRVTLTREGTVSAQMLFEEGQKNYTMYETPYGAISMGVSTMRLTTSENNGVRTFLIRYIIDVDSSVISKNTFKISIREV